ncbi:MAG: cache domain-containing protein [Limisphaerales bacterium]
MKILFSKWTVGLLLASGLLFLLGQLRPKETSSDIGDYEYESTRQLVAFVDKASAKVHQEGTNAFADFRKRGGDWFKPDAALYLFVYNTNGLCVFHPVEPGLEGRNILDLQDIDGRHPIRGIVGVKSSGWVHFRWMPPGGIFPLWKSCYVERTRGPDGRTYLVGAGLYNMKPERVFVRDAVDHAVALIQRDGDKAYDQLRDSSNGLTFRDNYIFVMTPEGTALVDPAFPNSRLRNLTNIRDVDGRLVVQEILQRLQRQTDAWVMFMWPMPGDVHPSKRIVYARKVQLGGSTVIVGSDYPAPTPIWMRM